jgi:hypothetical protein
MIRWRWYVALLLATTAAFGSRLPFEEHAAVQELLSRVHPRMRARWLQQRGLDDSYYTAFHRPESSGLKCIGRWPWGPSWELTGRDTFLYLGSGSGVRILSIADSVHPRMLGQINARSLVSQVVVQDSLIFVACGSWGAKIYSVSDPANPRELGSMDAVIGDLCVKDTFCYAVGGDYFRIYDVSDPQLPVEMGGASDNGDAIVFANGHTFVGGAGRLNVYDVTDHSHPVLVNSLGGPTYDMYVRRNLLFCTWKASPTRFSILNVNDPLNITEVSGLSGYAGEGVYANDSFALVSCMRDHVGLFVFDVSDSSRPLLRDSVNPEGVVEWQPYAPSPNSYGYLADHYGGLVTIDMHDVDSISEAWSGYGASMAVDVFVDGTRAYVADTRAGLRILDVQDPSFPQTLGEYEGIGPLDVRSAVARDSFAFITWWGDNRRFMRVLDVTDPSLPAFAAEESCMNPPEDHVLRDSLLYAVEENEFRIFNVARPRRPLRMGSCASTGGVGYGLVVRDSFAYIASNLIQVINVARPDSPFVAATINRASWDLSIVDSILFCEPGPAVWYSLANPAVPVPIDSIDMGHWINAMTAVNRTIYACSGPSYSTLYAINILDLHQPRIAAQASLPYPAVRTTYAAPYLYASCSEAGICIFETTQVGIQEPNRRVIQRMKSLPIVVHCAEWRDLTNGAAVFDAMGRRVTQAKPGVFFVREGPGRTQKVVVTR